MKHQSNQLSMTNYEINKKFEGFSQLGSFAAANQGPYQVTGYRHNDCDGTIALITLHRNAEGAVILNQLLGDHNLRSGVILEGIIYPKFPQMMYTILQIKHHIKKLIQHSPYKRLPVLAFAESGSCKLAEKIVKLTF